MGFFSDLSAALYDFKALSRELPRRSGARVLITLSVAAVVIGIVSGMWYVGAFSDLARAFVNKGRYYLPEVAISSGVLSSPVEQPYTVTPEDLEPDVFSEVAQVVRDRFHQGSPESIAQALDLFVQDNPKSFIFILDTTGTHAEKIDITEYGFAVVVDAKKMRFQSANPNEPSRDYFFSELAAYPNLILTPDTLNPDMVKERLGSALVGWLPLLMVVLSFLRYGIMALIGSAISYVTSAIAKKGWSYTESFKLAVYALVPLTIMDIIGVVWFAWFPGVPLLAYLVYLIVPVIIAPTQAQKS